MSDLREEPLPSSSGWAAVAEATAVTSAYILMAFGALRLFDISSAFGWLAADEARVVSAFIVGSLGQIAAVAVIWFVLRPVDLAESLAAVRVPSRSEGWFIALAIVAVETLVVHGFVLDVGWRAVEPSPLNVAGSLGPLLDGVTQEVFFRGYLILRLARAGHGRFVQLLVSSVAFSAIHVGYVGEGLSGALFPLLGTMGLGAALGWAFIRSGHSLRPPILAHAAILVLVQPWLALAR